MSKYGGGHRTNKRTQMIRLLEQQLLHLVGVMYWVVGTSAERRKVFLFVEKMGDVSSHCTIFYCFTLHSSLHYINHSLKLNFNNNSFIPKIRGNLPSPLTLVAV